MRGLVQQCGGANSVVSDLSAADVSSSLDVTFEKLLWVFHLCRGRPRTGLRDEVRKAKGVFLSSYQNVIVLLSSLPSCTLRRYKMLRIARRKKGK